MIGKIQENLWFILFLIWGIPLTIYRSKFRKMVYQTTKWTINIQPRFTKEIKALFGNMFPDNKRYIRFRNFYRFYLLVYFVLFVFYYTLPAIGQQNAKAMKKIEKGSTLPVFSLPDQDGKMVDISTWVGRKNLVIFFYPKDDSPGCTKEACYFRDQFAIFEQEDAMIIGISGQSVESHKKFAEKYRLTYTLLSDKGNSIRRLFGVPTNLLGILPGRVTYIVDKSGKVVHVFNSQGQATRHVDEALQILKDLK